MDGTSYKNVEIAKTSAKRIVMKHPIIQAHEDALVTVDNLIKDSIFTRDNADPEMEMYVIEDAKRKIRSLKRWKAEIEDKLKQYSADMTRPYLNLVKECRRTYDSSTILGFATIGTFLLGSLIAIVSSIPVMIVIPQHMIISVILSYLLAFAICSSVVLWGPHIDAHNLREVPEYKPKGCHGEACTCRMAE